MAEIRVSIKGQPALKASISQKSVKSTIQGVGPQGSQGPQGEQGDTGPQGNPGNNGAEVQLQVDSGYIQWKLSTDLFWTNLIAVSELVGEQGDPGTDGTDGADGAEVELQNNGTYVQWRYVGDVSWTNLIALADITGPQGEQGIQGEQGDPGDGDVSGPATNSDGFIPQWDGANSKLLKNGLGLDTDLSSVSGSDDTVPSAKATKAYADTKAPALGSDDNYVTDAEKTVIGNTSGTNTGDETTQRIGNLINGATGKTTPVDADYLGLMDSAASNILKKLSWANVKATLKTYFDTLYQAAGSYLTAAGFTLTGEIDLGENAGLILDSALSADGKYSGIVEAGTAGAALSFGQLCYLNNDDSRWELVDANVSDGYDKKLGICVLAAGADGNATKMLLWGKVRADSAFPTLTVGAPVYMSETAGAIVVTQPSTADVAIRKIGFGNTGDELFFCPSNDIIVHT